MHYHISQKIDCITRGGMCMPFHIENPAARRLSVDIDIITKSSLEEVKKIMEEISNSVDDVTLELHQPKNPLPIPLVTYKAHYKSCFGDADSIKIDILHDVNIPLSTETIHPGFSLFAFDVDYDMKILDHGTLLGDKLTTLSLPPLGLDPEKHGDEIPKQVYDVGMLLDLATKEDVGKAFDALETFIVYKGGFLAPDLTVEQALRDIETSLSKLVSFDTAITMITDQKNRYLNFTSTLLGDYEYTRTKHIIDIFSVRLLCKYVLAHMQDQMTINESVDLMTHQISELKQISSYDADGKNQLRKSLLSSFPPTTINPKVLKNTQVEYLYLLDKILSE